MEQLHCQASTKRKQSGGSLWYKYNKIECFSFFVIVNAFSHDRCWLNEWRWSGAFQWHTIKENVKLYNRKTEGWHEEVYNPAAAGAASIDVCNKEGDMMLPERGSNMSKEQKNRERLVSGGGNVNPAHFWWDVRGHKPIYPKKWRSYCSPNQRKKLLDHNQYNYFTLPKLKKTNLNWFSNFAHITLLMQNIYQKIRRTSGWITKKTFELWCREQIIILCSLHGILKKIIT